MESSPSSRTHLATEMKRPDERELSHPSPEQPLASISAVMLRMTEVLWQADATGCINSITLCRPGLSNGRGTLNEMELTQIEQLWRKSVRCAERFSAVYHVRGGGDCAPRTFHLQAIPVFDERDEVRFWYGSAMEVDQFADTATHYMAEAAAVLSSSLNRGTILNRLVQASVNHFCDICAVHAVADDGVLHLEAIANRREETARQPEELADILTEVLRTRQPVLLLSGAVPDTRSTIVVPIFIGGSCIGTLSFLESARPSSFLTRDVEVAVVIARQLAMALENIRTFEREQHITARFRFLARSTERLFTTLDSAKMLQLLLESMLDGFADFAVAASLLDGRLRVVAEAGVNAAVFRDATEREMVASLKNRRSILKGSESHVRRALNVGPLSETVHPLSWMMVPLFAGDAIYGSIVCCSNTRPYDRSDLELLEEIGRRASLALEHAESFARERRLTQTLQQATLPTQLASIENATLSAVYRPAASDVRVGGDWYDAFDLDDHRVLLTVGDVTGHGLQASIVMGKLRHAINVVAMYERNPVQILNAAERVLLQRFPGSVATAFVAIVDSKHGTITYANAGHPYPLVRRSDGTLKELQAEGLPIGLRSIGEERSPVTSGLGDVQLLVLYTDGLTEATRDPLAGERLLHEALTSDAVLFVGSPARFIESYCVRSQSPDDVAILALNFLQCRRWAFDSHDWHAARVARHEFVAHIEATAAPESDFKAAELIFGELAANVAQHAAGPAEIALDWRSRRAVLHMIDRGKGYACESREAELLTEHGRGLWLVQRLGAQLEVEILPGFGTHVQATLPVVSRAPEPSP
jgi:serine phosphatase RsbU (regulator of sigma subunit)/anti-sigma regulatory factor (Ser/Thr protein kinase)